MLASIASPLLLSPLAAPVQGRPVEDVHRNAPNVYESHYPSEDFNGDGIVDIAVFPSALIVGDGVGGFDWVEGAFPDIAGAWDAEAGDLDADGDFDIAYVTSGSEQLVRLLANDGSGLFDETTLSSPTGSDEVRRVAIGDLDGDGTDDLFAAADPICVSSPGPDPFECSGGQNQVWFNQGGGAFVDGTAGLPPDTELESLALLADVNVDGYLDIYTSSQSWFAEYGGSAGLERLLLNDGAGSFSLVPGGIPNIIGNAHSGWFFDADGDLDPDLVFAGSNIDGFYLNDGNGVFSSAPFPNVNFSHPAPIDLEGDGDLDVVVRDSTPSPDVMLAFVNNGGTFTNGGAIPDMAGGSNLVAIDCDLDGDDDLYVPSGDALGGLTYYNNGSGAFSRPVPDAHESNNARQGGALGDIDADGDLDAITVTLTNIGDDEVLVNLNDGTGRFELVEGAVSIPGFGGYHDVELADANDDGSLDLFLGGSNQPTQVLFNDGSGAFGSAFEFPDAGNARTVIVQDFDADGESDAFFARSGPNRLFRGDGTGVFVDDSAVLPVNTLNSFDAAAGDLDGDSTPDLLIANRGTNELYLGAGDGGFTNGSAGIPVDDLDSQAVALGDIDGDGDLDAFFGNSGQIWGWSERDSLLLNDGLASFTLTFGVVPPNPAFTQDVVFWDLDDDGDQDLLVGNNSATSEGSVSSRILLNDGASLVPVELPPARSASEICLGDVDGDGDIDTFVASIGPASIWRNLTRQLVERRPTGVGKTLHLDLHGGPLEAWLLAWSFGTADVDVPPYGTLYLDPATLEVAAAGAFDSDGHASFSATVSAQPAFVGLELQFQALSGAPLRLGNREPVLLTDL